MSTLLSPNDYSSSHSDHEGVITTKTILVNGTSQDDIISTTAITTTTTTTSTTEEDKLVSASAVDNAITEAVITVTQDGSDYSRPQSPVRPTPRRAFGARTPGAGRQESDIISDLERQISELQGRLDQAYAEAEQTRKASARRAKKAEQELASTRRELERAHERIAELEEALNERKSSVPGTNNAKYLRSRLMRRAHTTNGSGAGDGNDSDMSDPDATDLNELDPKALRRRVQDLETSHAALAATKRIVNERLAHAQQELRTARQRNQELESRLRTQQHLEEEYEQQSAHMMQLERALDEQRRYARGDFSPAMAPVAGLQPRSPDLTAEGLRRRGKNLMDEFERGRSLMDEFEMVLFRGAESQMQHHGQAMDGGDNNSNNDYHQDLNGEQAYMGPTGVDTLFNALAGAARAGADGTPLGGFMLDELVGAVGQATFGSGDQAISIVEDRSFFGLLRSFLMSLWRWFRFLCVLWCAVVVSVYRGPPKEIASA
jgi:peptidoglycan hydrolase CwlO-like protein